MDMAEADPLASELESCLAAELGEVRVVGLRPLGGGASREILAFDATDESGKSVPLVLSRPVSGPGRRTGVGQERAMLAAAYGVGVPAPRPYAELKPGERGEGLIVERVEGEALPPRILREERFAAARERLVGQTASAAARLHSLGPAAAGISVDDRSSAERALGEIEDAVDAGGEPHPAIELGLRWLWSHRPREEREPVLVHGDLRLGNLLVDESGLAALLDWELAHAGDPAEDFGWMCARSWRFGRDEMPALGLGPRRDALDAYLEAGGRPIEREELRWWEALANARWASLCVLQGARFAATPGVSLELGAVGRRACEAEWDMLALLS